MIVYQNCFHFRLCKIIKNQELFPTESIIGKSFSSIKSYLMNWIVNPIILHHIILYAHLRWGKRKYVIVRILYQWGLNEIKIINGKNKLIFVFESKIRLLMIIFKIHGAENVWNYNTQLHFDLSLASWIDIQYQIR